MIESFLNLFMFWCIYSFLGWVCEVIYAYIMQKGYGVRNRTNGPLNPGYGFAAIILLTLLNDFKNNPLFVFVVGGFIATILEFIVHWFFERYFGVKLWDYSERNFNIQGRVCLVNSILFGLLCVLMVNIVHPLINSFVLRLPINFKFIFTLLVLVFYTNELTIIVLSVAGLRNSMDVVSQLWETIVSLDPSNFKDFRDFITDIDNDNMIWYEENDLKLSDEFKEKYNLNLDLDDGFYEDEKNVLTLRLSQIIKDNFSQRTIYQKILYRVFPDLKSMDHWEIFENIKEVSQEK